MGNGSLLVFCCDGIENLATVDLDIFGGLNSQADAIPFDTDHRHLDAVTDDDSLANFTGKCQHITFFPL